MMSKEINSIICPRGGSMFAPKLYNKILNEMKLMFRSEKCITGERQRARGRENVEEAKAQKLELRTLQN